ncbi:MAG: undecaprenyldiphospho-muramoylpentapeptide beta-N-acetylglucosaminyltransferase [Desulfuromonas sp.]|nr:undecaprenyldiphospho-muramoylpentapeptide beta-N-acetylglucosaminyltransferase [Desulfuromonas sp.]
MKYLLAGGGTGGHVFPALAIARRAVEKDPLVQILFVGTAQGIEARVVEPAGFELETIDFCGFAGKSVWKKIQVLVKLIGSSRDALEILRRFKADVVIGVGGYASLPMLIAAALNRTPVVLHEQNAWPGLANRLASRWAKRICVSMADAAKEFPGRPVVMTGNPVRQDLFSCRAWQGSQPQLLVFGGSQGAHALNRAVIDALPRLQQALPELSIVHQSGKAEMADVVAGYNDRKFENVEITPFINDMTSAYHYSQLVLCRSGATTIAELAACGRPAVLVPFPQAAADHQTRNAQVLADQGAAVVVPQAELSGEQLGDLLIELFQQPDKLAEMGRQARQLAAKGAADLILNECWHVARKRT